MWRRVEEGAASENEVRYDEAAREDEGRAGSGRTWTDE